MELIIQRSGEMENPEKKIKRVTGIGGVFFKCKDPKKVTEWYQRHLGLDTNPYKYFLKFFIPRFN